jgi:hypothetical protein
MPQQALSRGLLEGFKNLLVFSFFKEASKILAFHFFSNKDKQNLKKNTSASTKGTDLTL